MSRYLDYCLMYSNNLEPLQPGETAKVLAFDVLPGLSRRIEKIQLGIHPSAGYDSHSSPNYQGEPCIQGLLAQVLLAHASRLVM